MRGRFGGWYRPALLTLLLMLDLPVPNCGDGSPNLFTIGVLKIGITSGRSSLFTCWCDSATLCGNSPLRLHVITVKTTSNNSVKVIEYEKDINMWVLATSKDEEGIQLVKLYLDSHRLPFLDYSGRTLPETSADWCLMYLKFAYSASWDYLASRQRAVVSVLDVVERAKLKNIIVVYDNSTDMEVSCLTDKLSLTGTLHVLHNMETGVNSQGVKESVVQRYLPPENRAVDFRHYTNILLWCSLPCIRDFLGEVAEEVANDNLGIQHMTKILIAHPSTIITCTSTNQSNPMAVAAVQSADNVSMEQSCCLENERSGDILPLVQQFYHLAVLWKIQNCLRLQTLMLSPNGSRVLHDAGYLFGQDHMVITSEVFPNTKWRLNGQKLIVATAIWEPFVIVKEGKEEYSGLCIDMLMALSNSLNFTYELKQPPDGQFGSIENGSWTGLVRMLKDKKAQLVMAPIAVNELRATVVDFSTPYYLDYTGVLFERPDPSLYKWKTYFMPFSWQVLMLIGVSFVLGTVFGHVVGVCCLPWVFNVKRPDTSLMDTVQYFFGSLLAQGGVWGPTTGSGRMFVSAWWLFCVILAAIYSGNLTASFAVSNYDPSFTTLDGILATNQYDFGTVPGTIWIDIFKFSDRPEFKRVEAEILQFIEEHQHEMDKLMNISDHVARTMREDYAYIGNMASLSLTVAKYCNLMVLEETFLPMQYAIALQKRSPLTDTVSRWILQMNEGGLDQLWASHWWSTPDSQCGVAKKTEVKIVNLEDCQSAFYILVLGIVVSLIAILIENAYHWFRHRNLKPAAESENHPGETEDNMDNGLSMFSIYGDNYDLPSAMPVRDDGGKSTARVEDFEDLPGRDVYNVTQSEASRDSGSGDQNGVQNGRCGFFERCATTNGYCAASVW